MSKKLGIKGHSTRGNEIIELLEMMGGINKNMLSAHIGDVLNPHVYFLEPDFSDNRIVWYYLLGLEWDGRASDMMIFTLEEFLEKFPYKIGDKVYTKSDAEGTIIDMSWNGIEVLYQLSSESVNALGYFHANELKPYKEESMEDNKLFDTLNNPLETKSYAVGLKDGKVIECGVNKEVVINEIKPLFKTGDVVKLKGCPDKNLFWIVVDVVEDGYIFNDGEKCPFDDQHHYEKINREVINTSDITAKVADKNHKMGPKSKLPSKYYEDKLEETQSKREYDELRMPLNDNENKFPSFEPMFKLNDELEYKIPDGYEITEVSKNTVFIKPIKPKYPKTYAECCEYLMGKTNFAEYSLIPIKFSSSTKYDNIISPDAPHMNVINSFYNLLICCDAYWKIAGEEMGLDKPWKPDWNEETDKFTISNKCNKIYLNNTAWYAEVLSFPTAEMRDAFYENFKDLIECCKELL